MGFRRGVKARDPRTGKVVAFPQGRSKRTTRRRSGGTQQRQGRWTPKRIELLLGLAVVALILIYQSTAGELLTGPVTHVRDGDTIEVAGVPIRLKGLNCAELGTQLGSAGRQAMSRLVSGQTLTCELTGERTYDREVGTCYLPSGGDITALLIEQGVCGRCAGYDPFRRYADAQAKAGPYPGEVPGYCAGLW